MNKENGDILQGMYGKMDRTFKNLHALFFVCRRFFEYLFLCFCIHILSILPVCITCRHILFTSIPRMFQNNWRQLYSVVLHYTTKSTQLLISNTKFHLKGKREKMPYFSTAGTKLALSRNDKLSMCHSLRFLHIWWYWNTTWLFWANSQLTIWHKTFNITD